MTAAEPPGETDSTRTSSPWRRPRPRWTLFDAPWAAERPGAAETDPATNGHGAHVNGSGARPKELTSGADGPEAAVVPSAPAATMATETPATVGSVEAEGSAAPATSDHVDTSARAIALAIAIVAEAITADEAQAAHRPPIAIDDADAPGSLHEASDVPVSMPVQVGSGSETPPSAAPVVTPGAAVPRRRARHAKRATTTTRVWQAVGLSVLAFVLVCVGIGATALVQGTWAINPVLSGSMRPGFAVGGVVISERVPVDQLALRDVIVFQDPLAPSQQIVHRIVGITVAPNGERTFVTQGDANASRDPWQLRIPGTTAYRVRWSVPLVGYLAVAYENHRGIVLIVAGLVLVLVAILTFTRGRRRREPRRSPAG